MEKKFQVAGWAAKPKPAANHPFRRSFSDKAPVKPKPVSSK